jgi:ribosomal protein S27AE
MAARVLDCPQCGAPVTFRSSIAVFAVCEHCRSMVVLRGDAAESMGVMAALPPDLSPFQIGTKGEWKGRGFEIVGRLRVEWDEGSWNEWCILYDAKTTGWLAEAQGLLMISFATPLTEQLPSAPSFYAPNLKLQLNGGNWTVADVKTAKYRAAEGELPFVAPPDESRVSVDFVDAKGGFASIELDGKELELFTGEYAQFTTLNLTNLRKVPGWNGEIEQEKGKTTALSCPSCGAAVNLRAAGQSMSAVCGSCGSIIDTATPQLQVIQKVDKAVRKLQPILPIGQRGKLLGVDCEVIGFVSRREDSATWFEYLLFNPWLGFQWLVSFEGHWTLVDRLTSAPAEIGNTVEFAGRSYKLFAKGTATVGGVLGEFYWKVRRGEKAQVADYIAPPEIISGETYPGLAEVTWSKGKYITPQVVEEAFAVKDLPKPEGVYLNQPNPFIKKWREIRWIFFLSLPVIFLVWAFSIPRNAELVTASFVFQRPGVVVAPPSPRSTPFVMPAWMRDTANKDASQIVREMAAEQEAETAEKARQAALTPTPTPSPTAPPELTFVTPHFQLTGTGQRVEIEADAAVDNGWLDLDMDLVNAKTNETIPAPLEISYYHGYDSDGSWTEGSQKADIALPAVPEGEYFLTVEPSADAKIDRLPFTVRVKSGGVFFGNCIVVLFLVMFYPVMLLVRFYLREKERWSDSDFSPYSAS